MSSNRIIGTRDDMDAFVERLRTAMGPMDVAALAGRTHISRDALQRVLDGKRGLSMVEAKQLSDVLDIDPNWLMTGKPDPFTLSVIACPRRHMG